MTRWFTSDNHIGHRLVAGHRGFFLYDGDEINGTPIPVGEDTDAHDENMARIWDGLVKPDDIVYVLGDTGLGQFDKKVLPWFAARPGTKHLITGNHDPVFPCRTDALKLQPKWLQVFRTINPYATIKVAGKKVQLSHFPYPSYGDGSNHGEEGGRWLEWRLTDETKPLLHGHVHEPDVRAHGSQFHVGWDAWGTLVPESVIEEWLNEL